MAKLVAFLRHRILWAGFLVVIIPLLIILGLQYKSLVKLETASAIARKVTLKNYLEAVATEVHYFYRTNAERALNIPSHVFTHGSLDTVGHHFKKKEVKGAKQLFVVAFTRNGESQVLFYNPARHTMEPRPGSPEARAVNVACAPWKLLSQEGATVESVRLEVNKQDSERRIILNPITDEASKVVGVAGMIIDLPFFMDSYLPEVIRESLAKHFPEGEQDDMIVTVHDGSDRLVLATQLIPEQDDAVWVPLSFMLKDWRIGIRSRCETPEQWAQRHFVLNLSLSILMTLVLIGGIVLALRTAAHAMKLSQMKTDFVSNVSHELRTPLASIRVFGEFLRLGRVKEPEKIREYGQYIETESRRLTQLINNILDFSKIESGQKRYQFEPADVQEVVAEALRMFEVRLQHSGVAVSFEAPPEPLPPAEIDPDALVQALMNLLDNAVNYSGSAKDIFVRLAQQDGQITIGVTDQGIGIPRDEQRRIFEKFYRVSTGLVHDVKGSGLGLAIVKHIVEAHHGKVEVESKPGQGSTFTIHLPVASINRKSEVQEPEAPGESDPSYRSWVKA